MKILYLGYWNLNDPLTHSTIFPNLRILSSFSWIGRIVFVNIEREAKRELQLPFQSLKIVYKPFYSSKHSNVFIEKWNDFTKASDHLVQLINDFQIERIIARGALAGGIAYRVWRKTKIPFYVESFEPHAQYMIDTWVWKPYDLRSYIQSWMERKQKKFAAGLMPVADNYARELARNGIPEKRIRTVACSVNMEKFAFSSSERNNIRTQLGIKTSDVVGIYAGRYGGLYMEDESIDLYQSMFDFFDQQFRLVLLVPQTYHAWLSQQIKKRNLPENRIYIREVKHGEVSSYLSASDFAFATYKPGKSMAYLSPVKIGEYWANGLPVFMTDGVGDETRIIKEHPKAGVLFQVDRIRESGIEYLNSLKHLLLADRNNTAIANLAEKYRGYEQCIAAYEYFLKGE